MKTTFLKSMLEIVPRSQLNVDNPSEIKSEFQDNGRYTYIWKRNTQNYTKLFGRNA